MAILLFDFGRNFEIELYKFNLKAQGLSSSSRLMSNKVSTFFNSEQDNCNVALRLKGRLLSPYWRSSSLAKV